MARRYRQRRRPSPTSQVSASPGAVRSGWLDELQIELDLDLVAEDGAGRTPPEAEVLAAQLAGGLEARVAAAVDELADATELHVEGYRSGDVADGQDRKSTRLNSSHYCASRMPSS